MNEPSAPSSRQDIKDRLRKYFGIKHLNTLYNDIAMSYVAYHRYQQQIILWQTRWQTDYVMDSSGCNMNVVKKHKS